ncbi:hypothetical protein ACLB2K_012030 [Fragaria x ananassa]
MVSPKFKRLKTLNNSDTDHNRLIGSVTTTTSAAAIPYLPNNVIEHILSFLPIKLAARATAVSKQWGSLWPSFPVIDFDEGDPSDPDDPANSQRFLHFLENCMERCRNQMSLDKLRLRIAHSLAGDDIGTIDECVTFVLERFVEDLEICFVEEAETEVSLYLIPQAVFSSHFLVSLNLEKVKIDISSRVEADDPITLSSLETMSLKEVEFDDENDLEILLSGCPRLWYLESNQCDLGYTLGCLEVSIPSLKSLYISDCHALDFEVKCINLENFVFFSECTCSHHGALTVWECYRLKHLTISSLGLTGLLLLDCERSIDYAIFTPSLLHFLFSGLVQAKVHFLVSPISLLHATVRITNEMWPFEYYSFLRDCLESFNCSRKLEIEIRDAEGVINS